MRVDFYQLSGTSADGVIAAIATRLLGEGGRLLIVSADEGQLSRIDRQLWDQGATSFLPHGMAGGGSDPTQPILLSAGIDAPNNARNLLIADGEWRDAALHFDRAFYLFGEETLDGARQAWKFLSGRENVERNYWANEDGKWVRKA